MNDNQQTTRKSIFITPDGETINLDFVSQVVLGTNFPTPIANVVHILYGMGNGTSGSNALAIKTFGTQPEADAYYSFLQDKLRSLGIVEDRKTKARSITSCTPNNGTIAGGTLVDIAGTGFESGMSVTFGGTQCDWVVVLSSILIRVKTPAHAVGAVTVSIKDPDQTLANLDLPAGYTYV